MPEPASPPAWALQPLAVIDTETTGLYPAAGDRIIEVAVIAFDGGAVSDRWSTLVDPGKPLEPDVTQLTGIRPEDVEGQPTFAEIAPQLLDKLKGRVLVAYNASFDRTFLLHEFGRASRKLPQGARWLDPLVFAKELQKGQSGHKLGAVAKRLGIALEEAHRAAADAECAGWVLQKLACLLSDDFAVVLDQHEKWEATQEAERQVWKGRQHRAQGRGSSHALGHADADLPVNALGPAYPFGDELDPVRALYGRRG
ncbi:MAG: 3'-5' exonuclease [Deltaproteobacteria bacterium]|nr:3'-5' exonuclease [Deltaproteobacteria bacterium]